MPQQSPKTIYTGTFISTPTLNSLQVLKNHAMGVDKDGVIRHIAPLPPQDSIGATDHMIGVADLVESWGWGKLRMLEDGCEESEWRWVNGGNGGSSWWFPGFVGK